MIRLSKRAAIMHKHEIQCSENYVYFELKPEDNERTDGYYMTKQDWEDFDQPSVLTVVVKPGDRLNIDEDMLIEAACEVMHAAYETAARSTGWETQEKSRKPWSEVPATNKATMRIAVSELLKFINS
jgi:hypothetical protein